MQNHVPSRPKSNTIGSYMTSRTLLGVLTPSSNTVMEPLCAEILAGVSDVSAHFGRFRVTEIALGDAALGQFANELQLQAADLLADAQMDVIAWGGTSGSWVGLDSDRRLCSQITARQGIPATTSTLAVLAALRSLNVSDYALVTPYLDEVQSAILTTFSGEGLTCVAEQHLGDRGNFSFSEYSEKQIETMVRGVAQAKPKVIVIHCTNFLGARIAPKLEKELDIPVIDSTSVTLWHMLHLAGVDASRIWGWGRIFDLAPKDQH